MAREVFKSWAELCRSLEEEAHLIGRLTRLPEREDIWDGAQKTGRVWTEADGRLREKRNRRDGVCLVPRE